MYFHSVLMFHYPFILWRMKKRGKLLSCPTQSYASYMVEWNEVCKRVMDREIIIIKCLVVCSFLKKQRLTRLMRPEYFPSWYIIQITIICSTFLSFPGIIRAIKTPISSSESSKGNNNIYYLYCAFSIKYSEAHHNSN